MSLNRQDGSHSPASHDGAGRTQQQSLLVVASDDRAGGNGPGEESDSGPFSPVAVFHSIRRNLLPIFGLGLLFGGLAGAAAWYFQKPSYESAAMLRIVRDTNFGLSSPNRQFDFDTYKRNQRELILMPLVLNTALNDPEVAKLKVVQEQTNPVNWLRSELKVSFPGEADLMHVSLRGTDPKALPLLVNAVVASYHNDVVLVEGEQQQKDVEALQKELTARESEYRRMLAEFNQLVEALGSGEQGVLSEKERAAVQTYVGLQQSLTQVEIDLLNAQAELQAYSEKVEKPANVAEDGKTAEPQTGDAPGNAEKKKPPTEPGAGPQPADSPAPQSPENAVAEPPATEVVAAIDAGTIPAPPTNEPIVYEAEVDAAVSSDEQSQALQIQLDAKTQYLADLDGFTGASNERRIAAAKAEIADLEQQLATRREKVRELLITFRRRDLQTERLKDKQALELRVAALERQQKVLSAKLQEAEAEAGRIGTKSVDLQLQREELEAHKSLVNDMRGMLLRQKASPDSGTKIVPFSQAQRPGTAERWAKVPMTAAAGFGAFLLPGLLFVILDLLKRHVDSPVQLTDQLQIRLLGSVPQLPARMSGKLVSRRRQNEWQRRLREAVDGVAATLIHRAKETDARVIMVSSALPGEGKTTLSGHLAISLARAERRTLLIDFDLRRPTLHEVFGFDVEPGMGNVLHGDIELVDALRQTDASNLKLLPAGDTQQNLLSLLTANRLKELFVQLKQDFDFVIVDSPPVLPVTDARLIGHLVDGVVLSLLRDVSRMPKVEAAAALLAAHEIPVLGAVLTGTSSEVYYREKRSESRMPVGA